jgi:2-desacetyl-2-hydroxyethyl bacteriochlorophyllide A dehydrogenase
MLALVLDDKLSLQDVPQPIPRRDELLVRVTHAGICNTDLELVKGYMGFRGVPGHEFVGVVVRSPQDSLCGRRVCGEINFGCKKCAYCQRGLSRHCRGRTVLGILNQNGAFAEYVVLPVENARIVPDSVSDHAAVFVEPLAACCEILEQVHIQPDNDVAVIGDGKLGLLITQVLRLTGCRLTLVGKHASKLKVAAGWGVRGITAAQAAEKAFDVVVEASGSATGFAAAMQMVRPRGTIVLKSTYHGRLELDAAPIVIDEISIVGSRCGQFQPALNLLRDNLVDVSPLISEVRPFANAVQAFEQAEKPEILKVILEIHAQSQS